MQGPHKLIFVEWSVYIMTNQQVITDVQVRGKFNTTSENIQFGVNFMKVALLA